MYPQCILLFTFYPCHQSIWAKFVHYGRAIEVSGRLPFSLFPLLFPQFPVGCRPLLILVYQLIILQFVYTELRICLDCPD